MPEQTGITKLQSHFLKVAERHSVAPKDVNSFIGIMKELDFLIDGLRYLVTYIAPKRGRAGHKEQMYANIYPSKTPKGGGSDGSFNVYLGPNDKVYCQTADRKIRGTRLTRYTKQIEEELILRTHLSPLRV